MSRTRFTKLHPTLPIFGQVNESDATVYTPGNVARVSKQMLERLEQAFNGGRVDPNAASLAAELERLGRGTLQAWDALRSQRFEPQCLTVYLSNKCQLACEYCYSGEGDGSRIGESLPVLKPMPVVSIDAVRRAAILVAENCKRLGTPFQLVLHGGGEPTAHWQLLQDVVQITKTIADRESINWRSYIATHGVIDRSQATWLADNFTQVGLSCDGPPDIQDAQRTRRDGRPTSDAVERTALILCDGPCEFSVRSTITRGTMGRQSDVLLYAARRLGAAEIRFEPAYQSSEPDGFYANDAPVFVEHFLLAQTLAERLNVSLEISGVRLDEIHGPHCDVLRQVLRLTPDNSATTCFLSTDGRLPEFEPFVVGDANGNAFQLDGQSIAYALRRATAIPSRCYDCVNCYHCARDCPDVCLVSPQSDGDIDVPGFRCRMQEQLTHRWLNRLSDEQLRESELDSTVAHRLEGETRDKSGNEFEPEVVTAWARQVPAEINLESIADTWREVSSRWNVGHRDMPRPSWALRGFSDDGRTAWARVQQYLSDPKTANDPVSVYVHIPFCDRHCVFCDCYSLMSDDVKSARLSEYARQLCLEIRLWGGVETLRSRPVTTIHFGGGTPGYLQPEDFCEITRQLRQVLNVTDETEWAIESTSSNLTQDHLQFLQDQEFTRLHVGVQTMEPDLRERLGRVESPERVLDRINQAVQLGFTVSVDVLFGVPDESVVGFTQTLESLVESGIKGMSLYHLNPTHRYAALSSDAMQWSPTWRFLMFQLGEELLRGHGFQKNHFTHFAKPEDDNLYYRHAIRGEDLLAFGTTADGIVGDYRFRHPEIGGYVSGDKDMPPLQGGILESPTDSKVRPCIAALMASDFHASFWRRGEMANLMQVWRERNWIRKPSMNEPESLTATGSWFLTTMITEVSRAV